jgi:hypothetical protein
MSNHGNRTPNVATAARLDGVRRALARLTGSAGRRAAPGQEVAILNQQGQRLGGEQNGAKWERAMRKAAGGDARYTREGIHQAAYAPVNDAALARQAEEQGVSTSAAEREARLNMASIASIPDNQISARTRNALFASAARGEETYAYPPVSLEGPRNVDWNMWYRDQRVNIRDFEEATGGVVEGGDGQPRLGSGR